MTISATTIKNAKPKDKPYKLAAERGMFLLINPNNSKLWRLKYRIDGKEKLLALGAYPDVSLAQATEKRDEARRLIAQGIDPSAQRQASKQARIDSSANSFEVIALEWYEKEKGAWSEGYASKTRANLKKNLFPYIGKKPIADISAMDLLTTLKQIENRGCLATTTKCKSICSGVWRYAVITERAEHDITASLKGALKNAKTKHHASITNLAEVGGLMRAIDHYHGQEVTKLALKFIALTFVRSGELRTAEWSEIDIEKKEWKIPSEKMKMKVVHIVPLATQAITVLNALRQHTGDSKFLFPSILSKKQVMSENTLNTALRRIGYSKDQMTCHGFRSMASTILNESQKWHKDAIERQLAHGERDSVRAAYNYAEHLPERQKLMQAWADTLDQCSLPAK